MPARSDGIFRGPDAGRTIKVRSRPSRPMNNPSSKTMLSRGPSASSLRTTIRSSGVRSRAAKSKRERADINDSINVRTRLNTPSFHSVVSATSLSEIRTARAKSSPSVEDPIKSDGFGIGHANYFTSRLQSDGYGFFGPYLNPSGSFQPSSRLDRFLKTALPINDLD